jgi:hypothetical protein
MNSHLFWCGIALATLTTALTASPSEPTAEDWAKAKASTGCDMIVGASDKNECISRQSDMKVACERQDLSCRDIKYKSMLNSREQLVRRLDEAKTQQNKGDVEKYERELSTLDAQLKGAREEAKRREEINKQCAKSRRLVMEVYQDSAKQADRASSNSSYAAFKSDIEAVRDKLNKSVESHVEEHDKATRRAAECRDTYY